ncbi:hypothetical protein JG688_00009696 [Phytophthora aleatoria]|uniref:Uncharacterized protein n=1 Tax=Phytophthora aleatoria TaxID=2496075 RepID=A0A8J5M3U8_9STRA|nr:hypothetical protein JG688_00009696 [Phytophthora aleatoria]
MVLVTARSQLWRRCWPHRPLRRCWRYSRTAWRVSRRKKFHSLTQTKCACADCQKCSGIQIESCHALDNLST